MSAARAARREVVALDHVLVLITSRNEIKILRDRKRMSEGEGGGVKEARYFIIILVGRNLTLSRTAFCHSRYHVHQAWCGLNKTTNNEIQG